MDSVDVVFSQKDKQVIVDNMRFTGYIVHEDDIDQSWHADNDSAYSVMKLSDLTEDTRQNIRSMCIGNIEDTDSVRLTYNHEWGVAMHVTHDGEGDWFTGSDINFDPVLTEIDNKLVSPYTWCPDEENKIVAESIDSEGGIKMQIPDSVYESLGIEKPAEEPEKDTQLYTTEAKKNAFDGASAENPIYANVTINGASYNAREGREIPYTLEGVVAIDKLDTVNVEDDYGHGTHKEDRVSMMVLDDNSFNTKEPDKVRPLIQGSGYSCDPDDVKVNEILERTPELDAKYEAAVGAREYEITGRIYPEVDLKGLDHHNAYIEDVKVQPFETSYTVKGLRSLEDAEKWLLENHPAEFLGSNLSSNRGDFMCNCVPSAMVDGDWSSRKNQEATIREYAKNRFGMECGEFDFSKGDIKEPIRIDCKLYDTKYSDSKGYNVIDNKVMQTKALSIDDAKRELLTKHPDYYLGSQMYSGDRLVYKQSEPIWSQDTYEKRYEVAANEAKRLGVEAGGSEVLKSKDNQAKINACLSEAEKAGSKTAEAEDTFTK